jgi:hypothetical protein
MERMVAQRRIEVPHMAARKRFGGYKKETEKATRSEQINSDQTLGLLRDAWRRAWSKGNGTQDWDLGICLEAIEGIRFEKWDIQRFVIALTDHQDERYFSSRAGHFLNALMMQHGGDDFELSLRHLQEGVICLGHRNTKNITIDGDVPYGLGEGMESGQITLTGSCGDNVGVRMRGGVILIEKDIKWGCDGIANSMEGGEIIIKGNVEGDIGYGMIGGRIRIMGDVSLDSCETDVIGEGMKGGEIHIEGKVRKSGKVCALGDMNWIGNVIHGRIFHKGKLIVDK